MGSGDDEGRGGGGRLQRRSLTLCSAHKTRCHHEAEDDGETRSLALCACIFSLAENRTKLWTKIAMHLRNSLAYRTPPAEAL